MEIDKCRILGEKYFPRRKTRFCIIVIALQSKTQLTRNKPKKPFFSHQPKIIYMSTKVFHIYYEHEEQKYYANSKTTVTLTKINSEKSGK